MSKETSVGFEQWLQGLTEDFRGVYNKEEEGSEDLSYEKFEGEQFPNIARMDAMFMPIVRKRLDTLALAANIHGEVNHERSEPEEKDVLYERTEPDQQAMAETEADEKKPGFWND